MHPTEDDFEAFRALARIQPKLEVLVEVQSEQRGSESIPVEEYTSVAVSTVRTWLAVAESTCLRFTARSFRWSRQKEEEERARAA